MSCSLGRGPRFPPVPQSQGLSLHPAPRLGLENKKLLLPQLTPQSPVQSQTCRDTGSWGQFIHARGCEAAGGRRKDRGVGVRGSGRAGRSGAGWWSQSEGLAADVTSWQPRIPGFPGQDQERGSGSGEHCVGAWVEGTLAPCPWASQPGEGPFLHQSGRNRPGVGSICGAGSPKPSTFPSVES